MNAADGASGSSTAAGEGGEGGDSRDGGGGIRGEWTKFYPDPRTVPACTDVVGGTEEMGVCVSLVQGGALTDMNEPAQVVAAEVVDKLPCMPTLGGVRWELELQDARRVAVYAGVQGIPVNLLTVGESVQFAYIDEPDKTLFTTPGHSMVISRDGRPLLFHRERLSFAGLVEPFEHVSDLELERGSTICYSHRSIGCDFFQRYITASTGGETAEIAPRQAVAVGPYVFWVGASDERYSVEGSCDAKARASYGGYAR